MQMSNAPIPPSPGPSRSRPLYGSYQSSYGNNFYGHGRAKYGRFRGTSWTSYRSRDVHTDNYAPGYHGDKPHFGWSANYSHPQGYDTPSEPWSRRDVMAERMFEPSESWKHDHVPDSGFDVSERFGEPRGRMQPPREDYVYPPHGNNSYRAGPPYIPRRDSVHPGPINPYRPSYIDEGRWNTPYSLDDTSESWAHQRSPSNTSRPPRGRLDYRDVSYEKSLSGSPRSSRFSSPRHSRATASRRAYSPSSSSIRSSRERSKSPPRSREHSQSSVRPSADSRSCTAEPPVQPQVHRSHPVGQFRGRRRGAQRSGMRPPPPDGFRGYAAPPFAPPPVYSNEARPDDRSTTHPLPLRPSPTYHEPGGRNHFSERGFSGPTQSRYNDPQASKGSSFNVNADQQGYQFGKLKKKRRGGINRKKRGGFQHQVTPARDISNDSQDGPDESMKLHVASPVDDVKPPKGLFVPVVSEAQPAITEVAAEAPILAPPQPAIETISAAGNESLSSAVLESLVSPSGVAPAFPGVGTSGCRPEGHSSEEPSRQTVDTNESSAMMKEVLELPNLIIPPSEPRKPPPAQHGLLEVTKFDPPSPSQSTLLLPVPVEATPPQLPAPDPSLELCSTPQSLPLNGLPEATTSSPASSSEPTPSLQTPSPPYVGPEVVVAAPTVQELEEDVISASPVSLALQAVGVPTIVRPDCDTFSAHAKEAESFTEALHMVVSARQQLELQSREERVNPILMSNRIVAPRSPDDLAPSADTLVQEVLAGQHLQDTMQAFKSHVRESLVANMAARQETVDEKIVRLRIEYLTLHREWVARCAELDNSHKVDPAGGEVSSIPARTTRRSAAVLGDAVRSDLEMEQIIASLGNDELYDPAHLALRNLAVIPDMISVTRGKVDAVVDDTNNAVYDPRSFFDPSPGHAGWTDDEVEIFKQRFAKYPKQFGHVAVGLKHKTQAQCVQFYYLHKKALIDFREAIATYGQSKRRRGGRKTDKKKGGLLADIRQHDAEVSKDGNLD
ncbi:hypothetical protein BC827DRAFT_178946 [Russula dissimulans]|nr:hypothetical protein BC827DRAFT_178946 [Russula dissimulans]